MDGLLGPTGQGGQGGGGGLEHIEGHLGGGFGLLVGEQLGAVLRQGIEKVHLLRNVSELFTPGLEQGGDGCRIIGGIFHCLADIGLCCLGELIRGHGPEIGGVEIVELVHVEGGGGLGNTGNIKSVH